MFSSFHKLLRQNTPIILLMVTLTSCGEQSAQSEVLYFPEAEKQNIDSRRLRTAFISAGQIDDLQGLAVARNSMIVAEEYFNNAGPDPDPDLHVMSVTKSISSALIGIAIGLGHIQSVNQTVSDFLGEEVDVVNPALGEVTIDQLLTMTSGQDWKELGPVSEYSNFVNAQDQLTYIFNKPVIHTPGTVFNYSDGTAHLISAILTRATGKVTSAFANQYLFEPMGIGQRTWYADNRNISYGGVRLFIGIHDMIRIGFLYLNRGNFNGRQIVPAEWIDQSTRFHLSTNNVIPFLPDYGYFWWLGHAHGHEFICANGYGGQFIFIVKDLNLVVCSRCNYHGLAEATADENWYRTLDIIINQILPAVRE